MYESKTPTVPCVIDPSASALPIFSASFFMTRLCSPASFSGHLTLLHWHSSYFTLAPLFRWGTMGRQKQRR